MDYFRDLSAMLVNKNVWADVGENSSREDENKAVGARTRAHKIKMADLSTADSYLSLCSIFYNNLTV